MAHLFTDYVDDNTPFVVRANIKDVIKALEEIGESLVNLFSNNEMKLNTDKCHLPLNSQKRDTLKIGDLYWNKPPKTSEISEFFILPYNQNRKLWTLFNVDGLKQPFPYKNQPLKATSEYNIKGEKNNWINT